jgi:hypothetical protein
MKLQTLFEPVTLWQFGPFTVIRTKDQQKLVRRLYNAETGFDYAARHEIPRIQSSRDAHMLNAEKLRTELKSLRAASQADAHAPSISKENG